MAPVYTPGWRESKWSKVPCLRKHLDGRGFNTRPSDPEFEVLTTRPPTPPLLQHSSILFVRDCNQTLFCMGNLGFRTLKCHISWSQIDAPLRTRQHTRWLLRRYKSNCQFLPRWFRYSHSWSFLRSTFQYSEGLIGLIVGYVWVWPAKTFMWRRVTQDLRNGGPVEMLPIVKLMKMKVLLHQFSNLIFRFTLCLSS